MSALAWVARLRLARRLSLLFSLLLSIGCESARECDVDDDCPAPNSPCMERRCEEGTCSTAPSALFVPNTPSDLPVCLAAVCLDDGQWRVLPRPAGWVVDTGVPGDCEVVACDGAGGTRTWLPSAS